MTELREVISDLRFPEGPVAMPDDSFLVTEIAAGCTTRIAAGCATRIAADGAKTVASETGGGPNGLVDWPGMSTRFRTIHGGGEA